MNMKVTPLLNEEQAKQGFTLQIDFAWTDIAKAVGPSAYADNTDLVINGPKLPAGTFIRESLLLLATPFQQLGTTGFNTTEFKMGTDGGGDDDIVPATELNANGTYVSDQLSEDLGLLYDTEDFITLTLSSMAAYSVSDLNAGLVIVKLKLYNENRAAMIDSVSP